MYEITLKNHNHLYLKVFLLSIIFCFLASFVQAQNTGSISGIVIDKITQKPILGANIILAETNFGTKSDTSGTFRILRIPVKTYNLIVSAIGFKKITLYNIVVNSGNE